MGESIAGPPMVEDKMRGSSNNSGSPLEVSVSFGRFESDSLSWEKWSSFSPNKYLEEVGKCATPGSVAQKKAYFEAHYKRIAARKIQELEEEKQNEAKVSKDDQNGEDYVEKPSEFDDQAKSLDGFQNSSHFDESDRSVQNVEGHVDKPYEYQAKHLDDFHISSHFDESNESVQNSEDLVEKPYEYQAKQVISSHFDRSNENFQNSEGLVEKPCEYQAKHVDNFQLSSHFDESNESSTITIDSQCSIMDEIVDSRNSLIEETKEEMVSEPNILEMSKKEENISVQEETPVNVFQEEIKVPSAVVKDKAESRRKLEKKIGKIPEKGKGKMDLGAPKKSPTMAHLDKKKTLTSTKKKPLPDFPKIIPEISTSKPSKPISSSSTATPYRSSTKKTNSSSLQRSKNVGEIKKIAPPLLHMSSSSLQRSKNVEEIKKIASASLHMSLSLGPANDDSASLPTNRKSLIMEKMGDKDIVKRAFKSFQNDFNQGRASQDPSSSLHNQVSTSKPARNVSSPLTLQKEYNGIKRGGRMDVQRAQLGRSLNSTVNGSPKGVNMDQRRAKPAPSSFGVKSDEKRKDEKEAEIKKFRQNLRFKATPLPSFYRGHATSKSSSTKEG